MDHDRLDPTVVAPELYKTVLAPDRYVRRHVDSTLLHLVKRRASLINGCAPCIDTHSTDAFVAGETTAQLSGLAAWRETPPYSDAEQAAPMKSRKRRGQTQFVALNVVYLALAAFIAWGRLGPEQFAAG